MNEHRSGLPLLAYPTISRIAFRAEAVHPSHFELSTATRRPATSKTSGGVMEKRSETRAVEKIRKIKFDRHSIIGFFIGLIFVIAGFFSVNLESNNQLSYQGVLNWTNIGIAVGYLGFGFILYSLCKSASQFSRGYDYAAVLSLAFSIFGAFFVIQPKIEHARLEIIGDDTYSKRLYTEKEFGKSISAIMSFDDGENLEGIPVPSRYNLMFDFKINMDKQSSYLSTPCPTLQIFSANAENLKPKKFRNDRSITSTETILFFNLRYKLDGDRLYTLREHNEADVVSCDSRKAKELDEAKKDRQAEIISVVPQAVVPQAVGTDPAGPKGDKIAAADPPKTAARTPPSASGDPAVPKSATGEPAPPGSQPSIDPTTQESPRPPPPDAIDWPTATAKLNEEANRANQPSASGTGTGILGYVIIRQLNNLTGTTERNFFSLPDSEGRVPSPGQRIRLVSDRAIVSRAPGRWDSRTRAHAEAETVATMVKGEEAIVSGDCLVVRDDRRGTVYSVIAPISEVLGKGYAQDAEAYPPDELPGDFKGYVYLGYFNGDNPNLSDVSFDNKTSPNSVLPAPNDVMMARSDIWLRIGPRHWDISSSRYVKPPEVTKIHKGDYIRIGGDIILTGKGIALWAPVSRREPAIQTSVPPPSITDKIFQYFK